VNQKRTARVAGFLYLLFGLPGFFGLTYVPSLLFVHADPAATVLNILRSEFLFRAGIVSNLIGQIGFMLVPLTLYGLFKSVDKKLAWLMVIVFAISVPVSVVNELNQIAALALLHGDALTAFEKPQLDALVMTLLRVNGQGNSLAQIFWGLWLLPFGLLVLKSDLIPRFFGILLIMSCLAYLASSFTLLLMPAYASAVSMYAIVLGGIGELVVLLWLLVKGVREPCRSNVEPATAP
jgi:hypothetical protein